jgi:hypothetical protein
MPINWGLAQGNGALEAFQVGNALGSQLRQRREQEQTKNALAAYATDPSEQTLNPLAQYAPEFVMQERRGMADQQRAQQKQQLDQVGIIGRLLDGVNDEATYQQRLGLAQQYGIDTAGAPQTFDPQWIANTRTMVQALQDPKTREALSSYGKVAVDEGLQPGSPEFSARVTQLYTADQQKTMATQPGGGVAVYNAITGKTEFVIQPNEGGAPAGAAVGGIAEGATATNPQTGQKIQFRGGQWVPMGGAGSNASGGFPVGP